MKAAVYACRKSTGWSIHPTVAVRVDVTWYTHQHDQHKSDAHKWVLLHPNLSFSSIDLLRAQFHSVDQMDRFSARAWQHYITSTLGDQLSNQSHTPDVYIWDKTSGWLQPAPPISPYPSDQINRWHTYAHQLTKLLAGRQLLDSEVLSMLEEQAPAFTSERYSIIQMAYIQGWVQMHAALRKPNSHRLHPIFKKLHCTTFWTWLGGRTKRKSPFQCRRCGTIISQHTPCGACQLNTCAYCQACMSLGLSRACGLLLYATIPSYGPAPSAQYEVADPLQKWSLSPAQRAATTVALQYMKSTHTRTKPGAFLLWAVTGAGKTEMIFPLIHHILTRGGKVLIATPRRDVVLELGPRIASAFPQYTLAMLYGGSDQRWHRAHLTLATTHQLFRFQRAFDLVIVDELDAFPFVNDPALAYAAEHSCRDSGTFVYLSATPPLALQRQANKGIIPHAKVPVRFHGHPLPVPRMMRMKTVAQCIQRQRLPQSLLTRIHHSLHRGAQLFLFLTRIAQITPFLFLLKQHIRGANIQGTSSLDPDRAQKVTQFRNRTIRILITTTILERGVTIPKSDVFVFDADSSLFDEASLVQMAGRAGRSSQDPHGHVVFVAATRTTSQIKSIAHIKKMNRIAQQQGYFQRT